MISQDFLDAKAIMEFYLEKVRNDSNKDAKFAEQYANLSVLKFRLNCMLNSLNNYELKVDYE